jgi:hypothetical protein
MYVPISIYLWQGDQSNPIFGQMPDFEDFARLCPIFDFSDFARFSRFDKKIKFSHQILWYYSGIIWDPEERCDPIRNPEMPHPVFCFDSPLVPDLTFFRKNPIKILYL